MVQGSGVMQSAHEVRRADVARLPAPGATRCPAAQDGHVGLDPLDRLVDLREQF